ncbi:MAG: DUF4113 domain-containing protein [Hydrogenophaga sp.]|uniref:DUF4113 domain-containing protein n=1 Tax=Hydrogenophaga sp. TaxID=1904254 RepID=UPI0026358E30|nr:DUF4113 domain-containing protein [Hydrogenophaga sp.]MDM7942581.1 DUF4113 domain-containing protein [Hydrogenophaga sp.]
MDLGALNPAHRKAGAWLNSTSATTIPDKGRLMDALDGLNRRYGRGTILLASTGLQGERRQWSMKQERRTPQYTTRWEDMPVVRA